MPDHSNAVTITLRATPEMLARVRDLQAAFQLKSSQSGRASDSEKASHHGNSRSVPAFQQHDAEDSLT